MSNEIRPYRGKRIDGKRWVFGCLYENDGRCFILNNEHTGVYLTWFSDLTISPFFEVSPETVGQFYKKYKAGEKDIDVYEGDVLLCENDSLDKFKVLVKTRGEIELAVEDYDYTMLDWAIGHGIEDFEIIGNLTDNPELMEET